MPQSVGEPHQVTTVGTKLTWIFGIFWAYIFVASIQNILVHQCCPWCYLSEEADFDRLPDLDSLALLYENLSGVLATVFAV